MIDERNFFDQPIKTDLKPYDNIRKKATGQGHDYTTGCLLDYQYFKKHSKFIAIDLYKQKNQMLIQNNFTGDLRRVEGSTLFFLIEEAKETVLDFSKGTVKVLILFRFNIILI